MSPRKSQPPRPSGAHLGVQVSLWLTHEQATAAKARAKAERWPLSEVLRRLLAQWVAGTVSIEDAR